jgi:hypothetical protein
MRALKTDRALLALLGFFLLEGAASAYMDLRSIAEPGWHVGVTLLIPTFLVFVWYWKDSTSRSFRRGPLLNAAMVAFSVITVPFYLYRSRARGERAVAFRRFLGFVVLSGVASVIGATIMHVVPWRSG